MLAEDIIEPSNSPWSSPVVLVPKKSGEVRFCVDFRKVNSSTIRDSYPLPYISSILDKLRNSNFFTTLDLKSGYWQINLDPDSRPITAFTVPGRGLYQFRRLPFGLHSAGATFQRFLDTVIGPELDKVALVYLDDIIVLGKTIEQHMSNLRTVFDRLRRAGLKLNPDKCKFGQTAIRYLGHIVSPEGIQTDPEKISAIQNVAPPQTKKEVRSLLGSASWYRRFVPNFAQISAPLVQLTKKNERWAWGPEQDTAFGEIKDALSRSPVLVCPDFRKPFQLHTDASLEGMGVALIQIHDGMERVVAYASRAFSAAEKKYCTTEQECLAVVWGIGKFKYYLEGYQFEVVTDHQCLRWLAELKKPSGRLSRWAVDLQQYDFTVRYRTGAMNTLADSLSRHPLPPRLDESVEYFASDTIPRDEWYEAMWRIAEENKSNHQGSVVRGQHLYRRLPHGIDEDGTQAWKLCVGKADRVRVLKEVHDAPEAGHLGMRKTVSGAMRVYYWPGIVRDVKEYVKKCTSCSRHKFQQGKPLGQMSYSASEYPWVQVSLDLIGPFPRSKKGFRTILVCQDRFTKWVEMCPLKTATTKTVVQAFKERIIYRFGCPRMLLADNGPQFASGEFRREMDDSLHIM